MILCIAAPFLEKYSSIGKMTFKTLRLYWMRKLVYNECSTTLRVIRIQICHHKNYNEKWKVWICPLFHSCMRNSFLLLFVA